LPRTNASVSEARERLDTRWLRLGALSDETRDPEKLLGKFTALAKLLAEAAGNLTDSYRIATDPELIGDPRREKYRALLQESAIRYVEVLLALDEVLGEMAGQWQIKPDLDNSLSLPTLADLPSVPAPAKAAEAPAGPKGWKVLGPDQFKTDFDLTARGTPTDAGIEFARASLGQEISTATSHDEFKLPLEIEFTIVGFPDGCYDLWPQIGDIKFEWANDYNRTSYVHVKDVRYTATHVRVVPNQENIVRLLIHKNSRLVITVNDREVFNRKVELDFPGDGKIVLGGGIGHVLYKQVRVRTDGDNK
jgi:hypothetical protein